MPCNLAWACHCEAPDDFLSSRSRVRVALGAPHSCRSSYDLNHFYDIAVAADMRRHEVFLLSRIREEYLLSRNNSEAVSGGLAGTARVITAAAVGLAIAIFVDASVVRMILVPSTMQLLGDANRWMPRWLQKMVPHPAEDVRGSGHGVVTDGLEEPGGDGSVR